MGRTEVAAQIAGSGGSGAVSGGEHLERDLTAARLESCGQTTAAGRAERDAVRGLPGCQRGVVCGFQRLVSDGRWPQPLFVALPRIGWRDRVGNGAAVVHCNVSGIWDAGGDADRQWAAVCDYWIGWIEFVGCVVGAAGHPAGADRTGTAATERTGRANASHAQRGNGQSAANELAVPAESF